MLIMESRQALVWKGDRLRKPVIHHQSQLQSPES